ncbi:MAG: hypothetical protein IJ580_00275 [Prevotella sp.]|nr:hypothetical protein [Prevotella sp.]MBR1557523.1 hypothetical protein [Prevotella sp.]
MKRFKTRAITKMLTLLGFSSAAFVLTACYGTITNDYREEVADSLSTAFSRTEADSTIEVTQPLPDAADGTIGDAR